MFFVDITPDSRHLLMIVIKRRIYLHLLITALCYLRLTTIAAAFILSHVNLNFIVTWSFKTKRVARKLFVPFAFRRFFSSDINSFKISFRFWQIYGIFILFPILAHHQQFLLHVEVEYCARTHHGHYIDIIVYSPFANKIQLSFQHAVVRAACWCAKYPFRYNLIMQSSSSQERQRERERFCQIEL